MGYVSRSVARYISMTRLQAPSKVSVCFYMTLHSSCFISESFSLKNVSNLTARWVPLSEAVSRPVLVFLTNITSLLSETIHLAAPIRYN